MGTREFTLDQLRTLELVIETGSFSGAAEQLSVSQPAVSLQIRQLERRLGVRLVERIGRRAHATAAGRDMLVHVRRIDEAVADALRVTTAHRIGECGRLRLGTGATACIYLLPPILRDLRQRMPHLEIIVSTDNTSDVLRAVDDNQIDVALVTMPAAGRMFHVTPVYDDELMAVFSKEDAPEGSAGIRPGTLIDRPLVFYEADGHTRRIVDDWFMRSGFSAKPVMELDNVEAIKELVAVGLGCSVLPSLCLTRSGKRAELVVKKLSPRLRRSLGLVMRRDKTLDRGLRELIRALSNSDSDRRPSEPY